MLIHHIFRLIFHVLLLAAALALYFIDIERLNFVTVLYQGLDGAYLWIVWATLAIPMLFRIFPNRRIAIGARKHFACSYDPVAQIVSGAEELPKAIKHLHKGAFLSGFGWLVITAAILFMLFHLGMLIPSAVLILTLVYAVVDLVFVLFFCPLRTLFMRNRCCVTCRIHNWDYFMKCAPMILFPSIYSISLVVLSAIVILCWEIALRRNPHFFSRETNNSLHCSACLDKLCQLRIKI